MQLDYSFEIDYRNSEGQGSFMQFNNDQFSDSDYLVNSFDQSLIYFSQEEFQDYDDYDDDDIDVVDKSIISAEESENQLQEDQDFQRQQIDKIYEFDWIDSESCNYPNQIKDFIKEQMVCQICLRLMNLVVELECKHIICSCCFIKITQKNDSKCPFCKQEISQQKETPRSKFLSHFINQLQLQCFQCEDQENIEDQSKNQNGIWQGKLIDLIQHLKFHNDNEDEDEEEYLQICQNHVFGCTDWFKNSYQKSYHLGGSCEYSWNQCTDCMKIVFKQCFDNHNCDYSNFNTLIKIQPDYKKQDQKELNYRIIIHSNQFCYQFRDMIDNLKQYFLYDIITFTDDTCELQFMNQFILKNFVEMMQTDKFQIQQQLSSVQLWYGEDYINFKNSQKQSSIKNYIQEKSTEKKNQGISTYQQKKVFVARIIGFDKQYAELKVKSSMENIFGQIASINLFGRGVTGKFYGEIEFACAESANILLDTTSLNNGIFMDSSGFVCSVTRYNQRHN